MIEKVELFVAVCVGIIWAASAGYLISTWP